MDSAEELHDIVNYDEFDYKEIAECFRNLRNACASDKSVQKALGTDTMAVMDTCKVFTKIMSGPKSDDGTLVLRLGVQFLGNLTVQNKDNQDIVWSQCTNKIRELINYEDSKLADFSLMILYNIILENHNILVAVMEDTELIDSIVKNMLNDCEFALYIIDYLVIQNEFHTFCKKYPTKVKLCCLESIENNLKEDDKKVPTITIEHLAKEFTTSSDCILKTVSQYVETIDPQLVAKQLDILTCASSHSPYHEVLQCDSVLMINCAFLLRSIHNAGKEGNNCFTPVQKLSEVTNGSSELQKHPAYGFKANLVRILGNLCWKNKQLQDKIRELECIPILLDCCNIDAKNPFIIQNVVFAVRNLCENNLENQAFISSMTKQGFASSAVLTELGITLDSDSGDNKVNIAPFTT